MEGPSLSSPALAGELALVTGGARRLGRAIVLELARAGADVVVHYHGSADAAERVCEEARAFGVDAWAVQGGFENETEVAGLVPGAREKAGRPLTILVNSASIFPQGGLSDMTRADFDGNMHVNAWTPLALARAFAEQGGRGCVVNLLDTKITSHDGDHAAYILSKHTLAAATRFLALELAPRVRVNAVAPGAVLAPEPADDPDAYLAKLAEGLPLKRSGSADDIARAVAFLVTSAFITGQIIFVDGGAHLGGA